MSSFHFSGSDDLPAIRNATLFSINTAFAGMSLLFLALPHLYADLIADAGGKLTSAARVSSAREFFVQLVAAVLLAACIGILLALLWRTKAIRVLLHSVAGFVALCIPALFWAFINTNSGWQLGVRFWSGAIELPLALVLAFLFLRHRLFLHPWIGTLLIAAHFLLWFWVLGNASAAHYVGPTGLILGFLSAAAWGKQIEADAFSQYLRGTDLPMLS
jgi:hypothetical protein